MKNKINLQTARVALISPNKWNPNEQSDFMFDKQVDSLQDEGQLLPILVREVDGGFEIVDGEHRWRAAKQLGVEEMSINNLGQISDARAKIIGQRINRTTGLDNRSKLKDLYESLLEEYSKDDVLSMLPTSEAEFDDIMKQLSNDWLNMPGRPKQDTDEEQWESIELRVPAAIKKQFEDQVDRLKGLLYPGEPLKEVSIVMPFEAMLQVIAQTPDEHIIQS